MDGNIIMFSEQYLIQTWKQSPKSALTMEPKQNINRLMANYSRFVQFSSTHKKNACISCVYLCYIYWFLWSKTRVYRSQFSSHYDLYLKKKTQHSDEHTRTPSIPTKKMHLFRLQQLLFDYNGNNVEYSFTARHLNDQVVKLCKGKKVCFHCFWRRIRSVSMQVCVVLTIHTNINLDDDVAARLHIIKLH